LIDPRQFARDLLSARLEADDGLRKRNHVGLPESSTREDYRVTAVCLLTDEVSFAGSDRSEY
jgi:hypothetical protein